MENTVEHFENRAIDLGRMSTNELASFIDEVSEAITKAETEGSEKNIVKRLESIKERIFRTLI